MKEQAAFEKKTADSQELLTDWNNAKEHVAKLYLFKEQMPETAANCETLKKAVEDHLSQFKQENERRSKELIDLKHEKSLLEKNAKSREDQADQNNQAEQVDQTAGTGAADKPISNADAVEEPAEATPADTTPVEEVNAA